GSKTIIPCEATVKITGRTVRGQDPELSMRLLREYLASKVPAGLKLEEISTFVGGPAVALAADSTLLKKVKTILERVSAERVEVTWEGGSIPIVASLARESGAEPLLVGF